MLQTCKILTVDEIKSELVHFYRDMLVNDPQNTLEMMADGGIAQLPNLSKFTNSQFIFLYRELDLGSIHCASPVNLVFVYIDDDHYEFITQQTLETPKTKTPKTSELFEVRRCS